MSEKKADSDHILNDNRNQKLLGILSGFTYNTENEIQSIDTTNSLSVDDLLILLKKLIKLFDPQRFKYFEDILNKHLVNKKNPHKVTLDQLMTSILNELYIEWKKFDPITNTGTIEEFTAILFQNIIVANIEETLEGISTTKVTSPAGVAAVINRHNLDPYAHENLLNNLFPGHEIIIPPEFSLIADIGDTKHINVEGPKTTYIGPNGYMYTTGTNEVPVDYSYLYPLFSIWGKRTNLITDSCDFSAPGWTVQNAINKTETTIYNPFKYIYNEVTDFYETETDSPKPHDLTYGTFPVTLGSIYTISVYCSYIENGRSVLGIRVPTEFGGMYNGVRYSLKNEEDTYFLHDGLDAKSHAIEPIGKMAFGKILTYSFRANASGNCSCIIWGSDLIDGDDSHIGISNKPMFRLYGVQVEEGLGRSPFIYTNGSTKSRTALYIYKELEKNSASWYNPYEGTYVAYVNIPSNMTTNDVRTIYNVGTTQYNSALSISYPVNHASRAYFEVRNADGVTLNSTFSTSGYSPFKEQIRYGTFLQSYSVDKYLIASSLNDNIEMDLTNIREDSTHIFIGCDRLKQKQLNGYLRYLYYYPFKISKDQATYFVSGE